MWMICGLENWLDGPSHANSSTTRRRDNHVDFNQFLKKIRSYWGSLREKFGLLSLHVCVVDDQSIGIFGWLLPLSSAWTARSRVNYWVSNRFLQRRRLYWESICDILWYLHLMLVVRTVSSVVFWMDCSNQSSRSETQNTNNYGNLNWHLDSKPLHWEFPREKVLFWMLVLCVGASGIDDQWLVVLVHFSSPH